MFWPFMLHPELAVTCAFIFLIGFAITWSYWARSWPLLVASGLWFAYAAWEQYCTAGNYNIRVDLLFLPIVMVSATIIALATTVAQIRRSKP